MAGGVEEHPESRSRLELGFPGAELEHGLFGDVEVGHVEIDMGLLGVLGGRPHRRPVVVGALEGDGGPAIVHELRPFALVAPIVLQAPPGDGAVETGQGDAGRGSRGR